jgi:F-type H+-transporting ATPase subunit c|tara:strand:- start:333 stop:560 length:228 start_codon:yes stop_codon:yes gene_type:complete
MTGDIATMGAMIGAGLATLGMGGAAIAVGMIVGSVLKVMPKKPDNGTMFVGVAFAEALGIFSFLVALLLMFAVVA